MAAWMASDLLLQIVVLFHILQIDSPEPTGFGESVTNLLPLPCAIRQTELDPLWWSPRTWGLTLLLFKGNRADIAKRSMSSDPVVIALQVLEDRLSGLGARLEAREVHAFAFERSKERLGDGVIPAVALAAHTHRHVHFCQKCLVRMAGVVATPISVMQ